MFICSTGNEIAGVESESVNIHMNKWEYTNKLVLKKINEKSTQNGKLLLSLGDELTRVAFLKA